MKITTRAIMTVYDLQDNGKIRWMGHRTDGLPDPECANVISDQQQGLDVFKELLEELQARGVKPGTKLKITVETVKHNHPKKTKSRPF